MEGIAIIGMAGKFAGLDNINEYWKALIEGKALVRIYSEDELKKNGVDDETLKNKHFVPVNGLINTAEYFDASFFGFTPREADLTDPQHRKFLEVCYEGLEHAGQSPDNYDGRIGVFAGCSINNYLLKNLLQYPELLKNNGEFQTLVNNDKDFLSTKVSYKLNLTGPSLTIQTACSTSLVAIHVACQNLLNYQCDIALGGGAFLMNPRGQGYFYKPGGFESPDGICRPFDKDANGTVLGEGIGVVVLKRLEDAIADRDEIWAVVKSSAINNDGAFKIGYMAPSEIGQSEVISMALDFGDIDPRTISYVETHGTGTKLGDPIELNGLSNAFREYTNDNNFCAIGSAKGNIGHCESAAGVAGIIKTALALKYKKIPPSINFNSANPELNIESSPFYVNSELKEWEKKDNPRRASVSSFGIGGTNAHCILEEWESEESKPSEKELHILPLSSKSNESLDSMINNLIDHLKTTDQNIGDIAYTLQSGRNFYKHKTLLLGRNSHEIINNYEVLGPSELVKGVQNMTDPTTVFMFTGQGSQYVNMAKGLYDAFDIFKNIIDNAHDILFSQTTINLKELLFNDSSDKTHFNNINLTSNAQPLLFTIQYATACLLIDIGIYPDALIGHSTGQITAATLSGVFDFDDALLFIAKRGELMQNQRSGLMLSINLSPTDLMPYLEGTNVELALHNAPEYCVVSGPNKDIVDFHDFLKQTDKNIHTTLLKAPGAYHSSAMDPVLDPIINILKDLELRKPEIPFISNVSGTWIEEEEACSPEYWANHIRSTVKFSDGVSEIFQSEDEVIFLELGPGNSLSMLLSQFENQNKYESISTIRHPQTKSDDVLTFYKAISNYWISGGRFNWEEIYEEERRQKVPLPSYPFKKEKHWINPKVNLNDYSQTEQISISPTDEKIIQDEHILKNESILHSRPTLSSSYAAPSNPTEEVLENIWQELLGVKAIGIDDNFFELGGHSLLASQLIVRINERIKVKLPLGSVFNSPTIRTLVAKNNLNINQKIKEKDAKVEKVENKHFPLSLEQKRLWIINEIDPNNTSYNIPFTYALNGDINIEVLNKSFEIIVNRHLSLKSYISSKNGEPVCDVHKTAYKINFIDFTNENRNDLDNVIQTFLKKDIRTNFNISEDPLIRIILLKTGNLKYVFHINVHHLVFDGWSWGIFAKEISQIYNDLIEAKEVSLPKPDIQYFDYSIWQTEEAERVTNSESIKFWKEQLKNIPVQTKFPYDHKRPELISGFGGRETIEIGEELLLKIRKLSQDNSSTVFMTMLSAFSAFIGLYSNQNDVCIGAPSANRTQSKFEKIIGFFVNTVVFRFKIDTSKSFNDFLHINRQMILDSLEHQDLSFEKLVDIMQPERILNINPLFQIMFSWQNTPRPPISFKNIEIERITVKDGISPLDLTFYMWEEDGKIAGEIEYNADILERESILHIKHNFIHYLEGLVREADIPISNISAISAFSQNSLDSFNSTQSQCPEKLLHHLFEEMVEIYPNKDALVISGKEKISYHELNRKANILAHQLIAKGAKGSFIGVSLPRSEQMVIAVLGILKAGANYLPLDPEFPDERLKYILEDSGTKLLITNKRTKAKFIDTSTELILIDKSTVKNIFKRKLSNNPNLSLSNDSLAYTIYTSGSTGNPKGVKVPHKAVVNFIKSMAKKPGMSSEDRLLAVTTLSFDISILELFLPLSIGASVVILSSEESADGKKLINTIQKENITVLQATPATWNLLLLSDWKGKPNLIALCGGEALQQNLIKDLLPKVKTLWNMYGPTETTVWSSCHEIINQDEQVVVGTPIDNTQIHILNEKNQKLPQGVYGEVCIGGLGLSKGYHNRESLSEEKFINTKRDRILYKTGDWGRISTSGNIELSGRIDNQIKLRGFRIEPGEIETLISQDPLINEVVVKIHKFNDLDMRLIAFVSSNFRNKIDLNKIKVRIGSKLPDYMIPSDIVILDDFKRTPNGKIDKMALEYVPNAKKETRIIQPQNRTEEKLLAIWEAVLNTNNIGIEDNFFMIGGHSLLAVKLISRVAGEFNVNIELLHFFENATIKHLGNLIETNSLSNVNEEVLFQPENKQTNNIIKGEI
jgi:amino acid adenylation domain-containing protein